MLGKIYAQINRNVLFDVSKKKKHMDMTDQAAYLDRIPEPNNFLEKAYYKYKCYAYYHFSKRIMILYNALALFAFIPFVIYIACRKTNLGKITLNGAVLIVMSKMKYDDIMPDDIEKEYGLVTPINSIQLKDRSLDSNGWRIYRKCLCKYWMHPYFCFEVLLRLAGCCEILKRYSPKAIVNYIAERDFSEPILLQYCNDIGVDRISFMHGTFVYSIDKAFLSFNKYYVWEDYYIEMFYKLRADKNSLCLYIPKKYKQIVKPHEDGIYEYFMTYYLAPEPEERLLRIKKCLDIIKNNGFKCKLRPHPRFSDLEMVNNVFREYDVEDYNTISVAESMENSEFIAAFNSTVLIEAFYSKKKIVIDDYVNPDKYLNMIDRDYIMLHRPHNTMSGLIKERFNVNLDKNN